MCFCRCALCEGKWPSLSMMDRRIATLFFLWDVLNVFVGAMLGGSIFSQLDNVINDPGSIPRLIGTALPASSNFFINYLVLQSFAMIPFRQMFQHVGILPALFRLCGLCRESPFPVTFPVLVLLCAVFGSAVAWAHASCRHAIVVRLRVCMRAAWEL